MSLPVFPDIMPPITPDEEPEDPGISTKMENGLVVSRPRFTKSRLTFPLVWGDDQDNPLTTAEKTTLLNFYMNEVKGSSQIFEWTCNAKNSSFYGQTFKVRFTGGEPKFSEISPGFWSCSLTIQEV